MFVNNFWEMLRCNYVATGFLSGSTSSSRGVWSSIKPTTWTSSWSTPYYFGCNWESSNGVTDSRLQPVLYNMSQPYKWSSCAVGTGTTPATADDWLLENNVSTSFSNRTLTQALQSVEGGGVKLTIQWTGTNSTSSPITISEFGLFHYVYMCPQEWYNYSSVYTTPNPMEMLCVRHLLEEPVTIEPGETKSIILTIDLF